MTQIWVKCIIIIIKLMKIIIKYVKFILVD